MNQKLVSTILLVVGELLTIGTELYFAAKAQKKLTNLENLLAYFFMLVAGILLIHGYKIGRNAFGSVWIVIALSICFILIIEPTIAYLFFKDNATLGSKVGFILGFIGMFCTVLLK